MGCVGSTLHADAEQDLMNGKLNQSYNTNLTHSGITCNQLKPCLSKRLSGPVLRSFGVAPWLHPYWGYRRDIWERWHSKGVAPEPYLKKHLTWTWKCPAESAAFIKLLKQLPRTLAAAADAGTPYSLVRRHDPQSIRGPDMLGGEGSDNDNATSNNHTSNDNNITGGCGLDQEVPCVEDSITAKDVQAMLDADVAVKEARDAVGVHHEEWHPLGLEHRLAYVNACCRGHLARLTPIPTKPTPVNASDQQHLQDAQKPLFHMDGWRYSDGLYHLQYAQLVQEYTYLLRQFGILYCDTHWAASELPRIQHALARLLMTAGRYSEALSLQEAALQLLRGARAPTDPAVIEAMGAVVMTLTLVPHVCPASPAFPPASAAAAARRRSASHTCSTLAALMSRSCGVGCPRLRALTLQREVARACGEAYGPHHIITAAAEADLGPLQARLHGRGPAHATMRARAQACVLLEAPSTTLLGSGEDLALALVAAGMAWQAAGDMAPKYGGGTCYRGSGLVAMARNAFWCAAEFAGMARLEPDVYVPRAAALVRHAEQLERHIPLVVEREEGEWEAWVTRKYGNNKSNKGNKGHGEAAPPKPAAAAKRQPRPQPQANMPPPLPTPASFRSLSRPPSSTPQHPSQYQLSYPQLSCSQLSCSQLSVHTQPPPQPQSRPQTQPQHPAMPQTRQHEPEPEPDLPSLHTKVVAHERSVWAKWKADMHPILFGGRPAAAATEAPEAVWGSVGDAAGGEVECMVMVELAPNEGWGAQGLGVALHHQAISQLSDRGASCSNNSGNSRRAHGSRGLGRNTKSLNSRHGHGSPPHSRQAASTSTLVTDSQQHTGHHVHHPEAVSSAASVYADARSHAPSSASLVHPDVLAQLRAHL